MGIDKPNKEFAVKFAIEAVAAREEDFNYFDLTNNALGNMAKDSEVAEVTEGLPAPTAEELGHLAPGCFVQVGLGEASYWVEIGQIEGVMVSGMVHPELSSSLCLIDHKSCEVARFSRAQITALGCDRYCWC